MEDYLVGIDFGACNLKAVAFDGNFKPIQLNKNESGIKYAPNAIYYSETSDGEVENIIGQIAINRSKTDEKNFVDKIKRKIEVADWKQMIKSLGREVTAPEVVKDIFEKMKSSFFTNKKDQNIRAILTVPVCFSKIQRDLIKQAAEDAGIKVECLISEPFAALFALNDLPDFDKKLIMIFDLGGSTLDVSIAQVDRLNDGGLKITELAASGIRFGGLDIDKDIYEKILLKNFKNDFDNSMVDKSNREEFFLDFARDLKEMIFKGRAKEVSAMYLTAYPVGLEKITLKRSDIENLLETSDYKKKIFDLFDSLFDDLEENGNYHDKSEIAKIFPFGGTCKIPFFTKILEEYFGEEVFNVEDFDFNDEDLLLEGLEDRYLAVAGGAVNYLNSKINGLKVETINVIPFCIGYAQGNKFIRGIARNMPFGFESMPLILSLSELNQNDWTFSVYQCFNNQKKLSLDDSGLAVFIGKIKLTENDYEKEEPPFVTMRIMKDGKLRLQFFDNQKLRDSKKKGRVMIEEKFIEIGG